MRESRWPPSFLVLKFMSRKPTGVTSGAFFFASVWSGVPSSPAPEKPPIFSTQPIMPHRSGGSSWYESLAPLTIARDEQYIAAHKPPIEENDLPTFNPSISLPSYLFLWPDCQRLPQCRSQYADLLLYLILTPYAASLNSLLREMYS